MSYKPFKISYLIITAYLFLLLWPGHAAAYRVSGVVEFTYSDFETKVSGLVTSQQYWSQLYSVNLQNYIWDPRFLVYSAGVSYSVATARNGADVSSLNYNIYTRFFPAKKISWDLFSSKNVQHIDSTTTLAGYDVNTTSYGGSFKMNLSGVGGGNLNSNYGNNNRYGGGFPLPSIYLSQIHTEAESLSTANPLHETRDNTNATLNYRVNSAFTLGLSGSLEKYDNLYTKLLSYENQNVNGVATIKVSPDGDLRLTGRMTDRTTENIAGYNPWDKTWTYEAFMDFKEKDRIRHYYRYEFDERKTPTFETSMNTGQARVQYRYTDTLWLVGGLDYSSADYTRYPDPAVPGDNGDQSTQLTGGVMGGVSYLKQYTSSAMGPFSLTTGYDGSTGFSNLRTSQIPTLPETKKGAGVYYTNAVNLGISSTGWQKENLSLTYSYFDKRDHSEAENNVFQESARLSLSLYRIPRTTLRTSASYTVQDTRSAPGVVDVKTVIENNTNLQRRALQYDLYLEHMLSAYLTLNEGASRGQYSSTTFYTLSTLPPATSTSTEDVFFAALNLDYPIFRMLIFKGRLRETYRRLPSSDTKSHEANAALYYRIRSIFLSAEYRWKVDDPDNAPKTTQQYTFVKLSRPF